ncbi:Alpha/Beta hydrolase protein [Fusarium oxysporum II5]|uniref:Dienelactone hydrolase domain-containing protein n=2 Tax=Fusarium oxysporum species complex TaxID=171631 RepID=X0IT52_FUSO5|nr:uncharacterized protein FOIG_14928 [Fusarium odoratissimum NRRL 54006]EXL92052.1 hypothetical protein FOIG_14928 [Fusarium odoratissimum NRRL 54006]KAK2129123.1 Alpha/Beta hydrolase protein [Fusarium oxysporum II5]TXC01693.1 hypothetical protein FocTR4_00007936 [Fusarium oxysporum f. sp. cubense]
MFISAPVRSRQKVKKNDPQGVEGLLAATRTTEFASRVVGVGTFLPQLSAKRFSTVGGIAEGVFVQQLDSCKSFNDTRWTEHQIALANEQLQHLATFASCAIFSEARRCSHGANTPGTPIDEDTFPQDGQRGSFIAVSALLMAIAYFFVAAWPGLTPARLKAYRVCEALFDILLDAIAPTLSLNVERHIVPINGEDVKVHALLTTRSETTVPGVLVTNGLEGTNVETMVTVLRTKAVLSSAWFFMEIPGTYASKQPMTKSSSELIYGEVLTFMASHKQVDGSRLGMLGISFGGNCATRMARVDKRLKAVVVNGASLGRSLCLSGSFGMPEVVIRALSSVTGAKTLLDLKSRLDALVGTREGIEQIQCHVFAINGEKDTLISTQDTINLATWAPNSELLLYPDDDHCAMGNIQEWLEYGS